MHFFKRFSTAILFLTALLIGSGKSSKILCLRTSSKIISLQNENSKESLTCTAPVRLYDILNDSNAVIKFYAKNDLLSNAFYLADKNYQPIFIKGTRKKNKKNIIVFKAGFDELFFSESGHSNYRWTWDARAESPASPLSPVNGVTPKTLQCWMTITGNDKTFPSNVVTIKILP